MPKLVIAKGEDGRFHGLDAAGEAALAQLRAYQRDMRPGETLALNFQLPRSRPFHNRFFAFLGQLLQQQEQFEDIDALRAWLMVGAGMCKFVPGPKGRMVALPESVSFASMDQVKFAKAVAAIEKFLWTDHARGFLWPHLTPDQTWEAVERLLDAFR